MDIDDDSFKMIINNFNEALYITNKQRVITHWNTFAENITGFKSDEVIGRKCCDNILEHIDNKGNSLCIDNCPLAASINEESPKEANLYLHHKEGHRVPINVKTDVLYNSKNVVIGGIQTFSAVEPIELYPKNRLDHLTQLYNKSFISEKLKEIFKKKDIKTFGILRFDIDDQKSIITEYGPEIKNKILQLVSNNILSVSRPNDIYGRWGDDKFIGIILDVDTTELYNIAEVIKFTTENSYILNNKISITLSIGGTLSKKSDFILTILERVDKFIFKSKKNGGNQITVG